jgi:uncharacterized protein YyaL (SSP411 family)
MRKIILLSGFALLFAAIASFTTLKHKNSSSIEWYDFQEGYDLAVKQEKMIMVDMYTDWCGYCKLMDKNTFSDTAIINKINKNFIAIKFNPEIEAKFLVDGKVMSSGELKLWLGGGKHYGYPTTYFWTKPHKNNKIDLLVGYQKPKEFDRMLDKYIAENSN